jgi:diacylglycerol kinase (ATP)
MARPELTPQPAHKIRAGALHALHALGYSLKGLRAAWQHEEAFRQEVIFFIILAPLALWLGDNALERALLIGSLLLVLIVEILNSALEAVVDRHGDEIHTLSGRAKDMGSAAVFLALCQVALVWGLLLGEKFFFF